MEMKYQYRKQVVIYCIGWLIIISFLSFRNNWFINPGILLIFPLYLFGIFPLLFLRSSVILDKESDSICIKTCLRTHRLMIKEIHSISFPRYEKGSGVDAIPQQACEIEYGSKPKLVQLAFRTYSKDEMVNFIKYLYDRRPDLGKYDETIWRQIFV